MAKTNIVAGESQRCSGIVFDIKRYAINDGPGIRTTIFLKGCPLHCVWCHNPEGQSPEVQKMHSAAKCIGCKQCVNLCPWEACRLTPQGIVTDKAICIVCGICADNCPTKATELSGRSETVENIMAILEKEIIFFDQSGGGVTFSGGEPLLFPQFLSMLLDACGEKGIHRTLDTTGFAKTEILLDVAKRVDLFLYDIKMMDASKHRQYTGVDNSLILHNLKVLSQSGANIRIRIPLIKGINDDQRNIDETARFINTLAGKIRVELLQYHGIAKHKHQKLGQKYNSNDMAAPDAERSRQIIAAFQAYGIPVEFNFSQVESSS
ncbi:MAG: glycyl-radical enzyme activating protein [Candidatus Sabulitectum sp.]|nr:glycyl-radical enzyme activating protein [Candidatus Sabulitectum sp.]